MRHNPDPQGLKGPAVRLKPKHHDKARVNRMIRRFSHQMIRCGAVPPPVLVKDDYRLHAPSPLTGHTRA